MIYEYPCVFFNDEGKVAFRFYDFEELHSFGDNLDEAILAAQELLADYALEAEKNGKVLLDYESTLETVNLKPLEVVRMIKADTAEYEKELRAQNNREEILAAENPIRELLNLRGMKIKELADALGAPYRTCQDWALGKSKPPAWSLNLILDKLIG